LSVTIEDMKDRLWTLDKAREELSRTENLHGTRFSAGSTDTNVVYGMDKNEDNSDRRWHAREQHDPAPVWLNTREGSKYQLTSQAAHQLGSECHFPLQLQESLPEDLLAQNVNWWLGEGLEDKELKALTTGSREGVAEDGKTKVPLAVAICRSPVIPYSNLRIFDALVAGAQKRYGSDTEMYVDYKFWNDLEHTTCRLIIPAFSRDIEGTRVQDDTWSMGIQFDNSAIGKKQTFLKGYMFRWVCTNGQIDLANSTEGFKRRGATEDDVVAWVGDSVDEIFEGIEEHSFPSVQSLAHQDVGDLVVPTLRDLFERSKLPAREQKRVLENMAQTDGQLTMYDLVNSVTRVANQDSLNWRQQEQLMTMGGTIVHAGERCTADHPCHRYLPPGWSVEDLTGDADDLAALN
jgi:hypothetical protein